MNVKVHSGGTDVALTVKAIEDGRFLGELISRNSRPCLPSEQALLVNRCLSRRG